MAPTSYNGDLDFEEEDFSQHDGAVGLSEAEFAGLKDSLFRDSQATIEREIEEVRQGTHEGYLREVADLERQRERRLEECELLVRYREESVNRWFGEEQREADEAMQRELESIKSEMMEQLREHKRRLEEERNSNDLMEERPLSGWRKSNRKTERGSKGHGGSKRRKQERVTGPKIVYSLKEGDINEDVQSLMARPAKEKSKQHKDSRRGPA